MTPSSSAGAPPLLSATDLRYVTANSTVVLSGVTWALGAERVGLVGPNGSGKTTLLRLLAGTLAPTAGTVRRGGSVALMRQGGADQPTGSVADALGVAATLDALARAEAGAADPATLAALEGQWDLRERIAALLALYGLPTVAPERPLATLSGGERTLLRLAAVEWQGPAVLLLDEPTNHLDRQARERVAALIDRWRGGLLVASHDRDLLEHMQAILAMEGGTLHLYGGPYSAYRAQRDAEQAAAQAEADHRAEALQQARAQAREAAERQARRNARGRQVAKRGGVPKILLGAMKRRAEASTGRIATTHERKVEAAQDALAEAQAHVQDEAGPTIDLAATAVPAGKVVLHLDRVTYAHPGQPPLLQNLTLTLRGPDRLALVGPNGCGKTTLLRLLLGQLAPQAGSVRLATPRWLYLDQRLSVLAPEETPLAAMRRLAPGVPQGELGTRLGRMGLPGDMARRPFRVLSGGEQVRATLACVLAVPQPPTLLVLDEPTNNLDLAAMGELERVLAAYRGALIIASHDEAFLAAVGLTRRLTLPATPSP